MHHCSTMCLSISKKEYTRENGLSVAAHYMQQTLREASVVGRVKPWHNPGSSCPLGASPAPAAGQLCHRVQPARPLLPSPPPSAELRRGLLVLSPILPCCLTRGVETGPQPRHLVSGARRHTKGS